jgi:hypothetical protein
MKNSYTKKPPFILPIILPLFLSGASGLHASILFTEGFETDGEGIRYTSTSSFSDGADDYFTRTDGTTEASGIPGYTGFGGSWFWAAEDVDSTDNPTGLGVLDFTGIDVSAFEALTVSLDVGAGSNAIFDATDDFLMVQYRIDGGTWATALAFENDGQTFNSGLFHDIDLDGIGEGALVGLALETFTSAVLPAAGNLMDVRIDTVMNSGSEAVAFDNLQVTGVPEPATSALALALVTAVLLLFKQPFLPQRKNESRA